MPFLIVMLFVLVSTVDATAGERFKGRHVSEALQALQRAGLRIVFSSEIVPPDLRVIAEPHSSVPAEIVEEILKPHGLTIERGPDRVLIVVRAVPPRREPAKSFPPNRARGSPEVESRPGYIEQVLVMADAMDPARGAGGAEVSLNGDELDHAAGSLTDDPFRALQSLPRVIAADDFRSDLSVRGSSQRHVGIVIDGVATPWLRHAAYGRGDLGSLAMFGTGVLDQASLQAGAYPQRDGDWLGAQVLLTLREGSRTDTRVQASLTGINGSLTAEGPLGRAQRGSWLVAARQSYVDWPVKRHNATDPSMFAFSDVLTKLAYDVGANHKLTITGLAGRTGIDGPDEGASSELANGTNAADLISARWDSTLSRNLRLSQQVHAVSHRFRNANQSGELATQGIESDFSYRIDVSRSMSAGLLEWGGQARRREAFLSPAASRTSASDRSAYLNFGWAPARRLTIWPGLRLTTSSLASRPAVGRWMLGQWQIRDGWTIRASAGVSHQFPELSWAVEGGVHTDLKPERASHLEIGLAHRLGQSMRWQASVFRRSERDVVGSTADHANRLTGESSGVELLLERRVLVGLSGWAGYSFGKSYYTDGLSGQTFRADFDRRHSVNVSGRYSFSNRTNVAVTFRGGSSFPAPGYAVARNDFRLAPYARLDFSAEQSFDMAGCRVTIFGEVINVLNRRSIPRGEAVTGHDGGDAADFTERLLPRMPLAGFRIAF